MKKILLVLIVSVMGLGAIAQNIQTHYDMGKDRGHLTTTVEMFRPDKLGNTFFFIDFDYGTQGQEGVSLSYFEIARCFKLGKETPFSFHAEYNGGFTKAFTINDAWLGGVDYSWNAADFSRGFSLKALYKNIRKSDDAGFQLTGVWYVNFAEKFTFSGFADFWKDKGNFFGKYVFLAEPQIWYNASEHFSFGGEVELSNNFVASEFKVMPTLAVKWTF